MAPSLRHKQALATHAWSGTFDRETVRRLLSGESGGEVHHPGSIRDLDSVYARIGDELRSQYTVGYVSSNTAQDGGWRRIELRVRGRKDLRVRHRTGYYAVP